jgi:hypothetical protein
MQVRVPKMASELKRFVEAYRYSDWIAHVTREFDFHDFMKGLARFGKWRCIGCAQGGGMPVCEVRECCRAKDFENCYSCGGFDDCGKLLYQKETYKIDQSHARIRQVGYEEWLNEQKKLQSGFDNIWFLEKKRTG